MYMYHGYNLCITIKINKKEYEYNVNYIVTCTYYIYITCVHAIAEHESPRIAGQWDVQGAWCNRYRVGQRACQRERSRITSLLV